MKKREKTAGGVVFDSSFRKIYLVYQKERKEWLLPKGHIEKGENTVAAARREVLEETGLEKVKVIGSSPCTTNIFKLSNGNTKSLVVFVMVTQNKATQNTQQRTQEGLTGRWFSVKKAIKQAEHEDIKQAIKKACRKVKDFAG